MKHKQGGKTVGVNQNQSLSLQHVRCTVIKANGQKTNNSDGFDSSNK
jgi:hypothetical protein